MISQFPMPPAYRSTTNSLPLGRQISPLRGFVQPNRRWVARVHGLGFAMPLRIWLLQLRVTIFTIMKAVLEKDTCSELKLE